MKKKSLISMVVTICLIAVVMVGATLAYYSAQTGELVNTFTVGNVDIDLTEPKWDPDKGEDLVPGSKVDKDPMITNIGASAGYMMLEVKGMEEMAALGFVAMTGDNEKYNTADWVLVNKNGEVRTDNPDNKLVDGYYVYIGKPVANAETPAGTVEAGKSTSALFTAVKLSENAKELVNTAYQVEGEVVVDGDGNVVMENGSPKVVYKINGVTGQEFTSYAAAEKYVMDNYKEQATFVFNLTVKGYAIQSENIAFQTNGAYAWVAELTK